MTRQTQRDWILARLREGARLTPLDAQREIGCLRLGARVWDLRQAGYDIRSEMVEVSNRFGEPCRVASYRLAGEAQGRLFA